ncbi:MAG TPA: tetrahydrofolate dehydrogenase/cyclohydrolase catalytic domain-containing protein, partial [Thermoguttaceae bacterium]|nr:tetrahydrofolate dehydrogenase/cyclohydrolase catalytic domain-containing protein [Thermoguttaceae bacterium]
MTAEILDGKQIAAAIRAELAQEIADFVQKTGVTPGLATVLVGDNPASVSYVTAKGRTCQELGMQSFQHTLPASLSEQELLELVDRLNRDRQVHGILV